MFWGSISRLRKGPGIFWEKSWGRIGSISYCEHIVLMVDEYIRRIRLQFIQDNALGHAAKDTLAYITSLGF
jgi:hypothetical protein